MLLEIEVELSAGIEADLNRSLEDVTAQIVITVAEDAPPEMALMMPEGAGKPSVKGNPPNRQTGAGVRSLAGQVISPTEAEIEGVEYLLALDKSRPFIELGIERALQKSI